MLAGEDSEHVAVDGRHQRARIGDDRCAEDPVDPAAAQLRDAGDPVLWLADEAEPIENVVPERRVVEQPAVPIA